MKFRRNLLFHGVYTRAALNTSSNYSAEYLWFIFTQIGAPAVPGQTKKCLSCNKQNAGHP